MRRWWFMGLIVAFAPSAWAHPGRTDACRGHYVRSAVVPETAPDATHYVPDFEVGEYHVHVNDDQANRLIQVRVGEVVRLDGVEYEIMPAGKHGEIIVRCETPDGAQPAGIVRVLK